MSDVDLLRRGAGVACIWKGIRSNDIDLIKDVMYDMESEDLLYVYSSLRSELFNRYHVVHLDNLSKKYLNSCATFLDGCYKEIVKLRKEVSDLSDMLSSSSSLPDTYQTYQERVANLGKDPMTFHEWEESRDTLNSVSVDKGN